MKYYIYCYKLPFTMAQFKIGNNYTFMQNIMSYNKSADQPIYTIKEKSITPDKIATVGIADLNNYQNKFIRKIMPKNTEIVEEVSNLEWPCSINKYTCPNRPEVNGLIATYYSTDKMDTAPQYFLQYIDASFKKDLSVKHIDLTSKEDKDAIYVYRLVKTNFDVFGQSMIEPICGKMANMMFKNSYKSAIQYKGDWIDKTEDDILKLLNGEGVSTVEINEKEVDDVEK